MPADQIRHGRRPARRIAVDDAGHEPGSRHGQARQHRQGESVAQVLAGSFSWSAGNAIGSRRKRQSTSASLMSRTARSAAMPSFSGGSPLYCRPRHDPEEVRGVGTGRDQLHRHEIARHGDQEPDLGLRRRPAPRATWPPIEGPPNRPSCTATGSSRRTSARPGRPSRRSASRNRRRLRGRIGPAVDEQLRGLLADPERGVGHQLLDEAGGVGERAVAQLRQPVVEARGRGAEAAQLQRARVARRRPRRPGRAILTVAIDGAPEVDPRHPLVQRADDEAPRLQRTSWPTPAAGRLGSVRSRARAARSWASRRTRRARPDRRAPRTIRPSGRCLSRSSRSSRTIGPSRSPNISRMNRIASRASPSDEQRRGVLDRDQADVAVAGAHRPPDPISSVSPTESMLTVAGSDAVFGPASLPSPWISIVFELLAAALPGRVPAGLRPDVARVAAAHPQSRADLGRRRPAFRRGPARRPDPEARPGRGRWPHRRLADRRMPPPPNPPPSSMPPS